MTADDKAGARGSDGVAAALALVQRQFWSGVIVVIGAIVVSVHPSAIVGLVASVVGLIALGVHAHGSMASRQETDDPSGLFVSAGLAGLLIYVVAGSLRDGRPLLGMDGAILGQVALAWAALLMGSGIWISYRRKKEMERRLVELETTIEQLELRLAEIVARTEALPGG